MLEAIDLASENNKPALRLLSLKEKLLLRTSSLFAYDTNIDC